jgi:hypothetical protein
MSHVAMPHVALLHDPLPSQVALVPQVAVLSHVEDPPQVAPPPQVLPLQVASDTVGHA